MNINYSFNFMLFLIKLYCISKVYFIFISSFQLGFQMKEELQILVRTYCSNLMCCFLSLRSLCRRWNHQTGHERDVFCTNLLSW